MKLSPKQVAQIRRKIGSNQVYYSDILTELTDHVACEIEANLKKVDEFECLLQKKLAEINPQKFQRQLLMQAHVYSLRDFLANLGNPKVMVKTLVMILIIGSFINLFSTNTPEFAEKVLKTSFLIASYGGFLLGLWKTKCLRNSQVLTAANVLFLIASLLQFSLKIEWLTWTGASNQQLLFFMTACFSFILCSGYANLFRQIKKLQWQ